LGLVLFDTFAVSSTDELAEREPGDHRVAELLAKLRARPTLQHEPQPGQQNRHRRHQDRAEARQACLTDRSVATTEDTAGSASTSAFIRGQRQRGTRVGPQPRGANRSILPIPQSIKVDTPTTLLWNFDGSAF
jgi:hypothetical protein